jgi:cyanophycinase-like exopeptidase
MERTMPRVQDAPPGLVILGIDEDTVILRTGGTVRVLGRGTVTVWRDRHPTVLRSGDDVPSELVPLP